MFCQTIIEMNATKICLIIKRYVILNYLPNLIKIICDTKLV